MIKLLEILWALFSPKPIQKEGSLIKPEALKVTASKPAKHLNNGSCPKCLLIFDRYPGFHQGLKDWFLEIQKNHPEAHISGAGRGKLEQEEYFKKKTSKAHYGQSSHSYNAAIDIFKLHDNGAEWPKEWFGNVIKSAVDSHNSMANFKVEWYGTPGAPYPELPHCEVKGWKDLVKQGLLVLVEPA